MTRHGENPRLRYDEGCLAAHALNLIGDRWALLVVRELMFATKRFQTLRAGMPGISASVLTARLAQLRDAGVIAHDEKLGLYALTDAGRALLPVLEALCRWALIVPGHDHTKFISPSALMVSMGVGLAAEPEIGRVALAGFDFGVEAFQMRVAEGRVETVAVKTPNTPFVLKGNGNTLAIAVYGTVSLTTLVSEGVVGVTGDMARAQEFVDLFWLDKRSAVA
ncbi:helix-turn-helix transcriptional regulator [Paracoccus sp. 11-3]|uniref:Helix-turn-helix transcriptional regulator n=1 Tax=Paracoccus amoyensis TaxID=2760093 RepID=A0A926J5U5_9RHOB|nr:helix-turn-helix domain-containing protein [Paracoccus amoyensis]MBC9246592.1 helix-turn-helix transcriptional regulator [Paracoccus amoyensis]